MVLKLVFTIVIVVLVTFFTGFNLGNVCNIWLFGRTFENVPVFITVLISFAAGILAALPIILFRHKKKMTPEQARAQAERLELQQKKKHERQLKARKKLEAANARASKRKALRAEGEAALISENVQNETSGTSQEAGE